MYLNQAVLLEQNYITFFYRKQFQIRKTNLKL